MTTATKWLTPQSTSGSIIAALGVHGLLYGAVILILGIGILRGGPTPPAEVEIGYEVLNDAPVPVRPPHVDTKPRELQDEKGEVKGTEVAKPTPASSGIRGATNTDAPPFYKIKPKYPRAALVSGEEGWVLMKVDITQAGTVENIRVVAGEKRSLFEGEAKRAVAQWKYRPFLDADGKPVALVDHQVRVAFNLKDN